MKKPINYSEVHVFLEHSTVNSVDASDTSKDPSVKRAQRRAYDYVRSFVMNPIKLVDAIAAQTFFSAYDKNGEPEDFNPSVNFFPAINEDNAQALRACFIAADKGKDKLLHHRNMIIAFMDVLDLNNQAAQALRNKDKTGRVNFNDASVVKPKENRDALLSAVGFYFCLVTEKYPELSKHVNQRRLEKAAKDISVDFKNVGWAEEKIGSGARKFALGQLPDEFRNAIETFVDSLKTIGPIEKPKSEPQ